MKNARLLTNRKGDIRNRVSIFMFVVLGLLVVSSAHAWNLGAKKVEAVQVKKSGMVRFTLLDSPTKEFMCKGTDPWLIISPCESSNHVCIAAADRMASTLVAAKLSGKAVHVQQTNCSVTEVALKP